VSRSLSGGREDRREESPARDRAQASRRSSRPRRPRIVACDLDGTLVRSDGTVSDRTVQALHRAEEAGATVVFVTGRPPRWMHDVAAQTGSRGLAICSNGALLYDLGARSVVLGRLLTPDVGQRLVSQLRTAFPGIAFAVEGEDGFAREPGYRARYDIGQEHRVGPAVELLDEPVAKLLARHEDMTSDELLDAARAIVGDAATLTHSSSGLGGALLEISAPGVSKATTLELLCTQRGLTFEDVLAFGDMPNDLPLLSWAGSAWAMANAHPDVLAAVDSVTTFNDDDGVARVLEDVFD
jgi:Cof subfamily protein (haloacid dehalogenase superfamily)